MTRNGGCTRGRMMRALRWLMAPERLDEEAPPPPRGPTFVAWLLSPESLDVEDSVEPTPEPWSFRGGPLAFWHWVFEPERLEEDPDVRS